MRRLASILPLAAVLLAGCRFHAEGPARTFKPEGETVTVEPAKGLSATGELIAVEAERLVLLREGRYVAVPLSSLRSVLVKGYPRVSVREEQARLVLYARYPQGLGPESWQRLLRLSGQEEPDPFPAPGDIPAGPERPPGSRGP